MAHAFHDIIESLFKIPRCRYGRSGGQPATLQTCRVDDLDGFREAFRHFSFFEGETFFKASPRTAASVFDKNTDRS